jgi:hypothetical protein
LDADERAHFIDEALFNTPEARQFGVLLLATLRKIKGVSTGGVAANGQQLNLAADN